MGDPSRGRSERSGADSSQEWSRWREVLEGAGVMTQNSERGQTSGRAGRLRPVRCDDATSFEAVVPRAVAEIFGRIEEQADRYTWLVFEKTARFWPPTLALAAPARPSLPWCAEVSVYVPSRGHRRGSGARDISALRASCGPRRAIVVRRRGTCRNVQHWVPINR